MVHRCVDRLSLAVLVSAFLGAGAPALAADATPAETPSPITAAWMEASKSFVRGPTKIALKDQAELNLPEHYAYLPAAPAAKLMSRMGNSTGENFLGLVIPTGDDKAEFFVTVVFDPAGYVKDDDAKHWDADGLLKSLKEGTEAQNAVREASGIPGFIVTRWVEVPTYQEASHQLVWSVETRAKKGPDTDPGVNYNTYILGRDGYVSLDLVTSLATVEADKVRAHALLDAIDFKSGKRYADFAPSTDKVAAYGLAALVAGVAAKKLGLLALFGVTIVKFAKVIIVAVTGGAAVLARWMRGRGAKKDPTP